jgi:hypothetical protein
MPPSDEPHSPLGRSPAVVKVALLGADDLEVLVDEDVVRPVDTDVMDVATDAATGMEATRKVAERLADID